MKIGSLPTPALDPFKPHNDTEAAQDLESSAAGGQIGDAVCNVAEVVPENNATDNVNFSSSPDEPAKAVPAPWKKPEPRSYNDFETDLSGRCMHVFPKIVNKLIRNGAAYHEAEDAAQEAFLAAWRKRETLQAERPDQATLANSWLYKAAYFVILTSWAKSRKHPTTGLEDMPEIFEQDGSDYVATLDIIMRGIASLTSRKRDIASRLLLGMTVKEIAENLGITDNAVRVQMTYMRRDMTAYLQQHTGG